MGGGAEPKSRPSRLAFHHRQCPHETETFVSKDSCLTEYYLVATYDRFTPTGVGTIRSRSSKSAMHTVHPHGRGDNLPQMLLSMRIGGSPPRAWGQSHARLSFGSTIRFTPTGVGTLNTILLDGRYSTVHPHGRGDNGHAIERMQDNAGSPPRAWGQ